MMKVGLVNSITRGELDCDDAFLEAALQARGYETALVFWDSQNQAYDGADRCDFYMNRSAFDYHKNIAAFTRWLDDMAQNERVLLNPVDVIKGNLGKQYLSELAAKNITIVASEFIEGDDFQAVQKRIAARGWTEIVCKPYVGAAGAGLLRIKTEALTEADLQAFETEGKYSFLAQDYMSEAADFGELSFVFFGSDLSHTVLKRPASGDYRVNGAFGASCALYEPSADIMAQARQMMARTGLSDHLLYARLDCLVRAGTLYLSELELNEPWLFFSENPASCDRFIDRMEEMLSLQNLKPQTQISTQQGSAA